MIKIFKKFLLGILVVGMGTVLVYYPNLKRVWKAIHFTDKEEIAKNFTTVNKYWRTREAKRSDTPYIFPKGQPINLPQSFSYRGKTFNLILSNI